MKTFLKLLLFVPISTLAQSLIWEPLNKETIAGTWEAVMPIESTMVAGVYRLEMRGDSDSYLVGIIARSSEQPWERFVLHLTASQIADGNVKLLFRGQFEGKEAEVVFAGSGAGLPEQGAIGGRFKYTNGKPFDNYPGEIWFKKGSWVRDLDRSSREAEKTIEQLRAKPKG